MFKNGLKSDQIKFCEYLVKKLVSYHCFCGQRFKIFFWRGNLILTLGSILGPVLFVLYISMARADCGRNLFVGLSVCQSVGFPVC